MAGNTRTTVSKMQRAATAYAGYACRVFPCAPHSKTPLTDNGYKDAAQDAAQIAAWWERWPDANVALACAPSGYIALDVDPHRLDDNGRAFVDNLEANFPTATQDTPTGGCHYLYMLPPDVSLSNSAGQLPAGIDVRVNGYILLSPSEVTYRGDDAKAKGVPDGFAGRYAWREDMRPTEFPPTTLPDHVLALLKTKDRIGAPPPSPAPTYTNGTAGPLAARYAQAALEKELDELARTPEGGRNEQLNKSAFSLGQLVAGRALDESEVIDKLESVALAIGLDAGEIRGTIKSGLNSGKQSPRGVPEMPEIVWPVFGQPESAPNGDGAAAPRRVTFIERPHNTDMGNAKRMHAFVQGKVFYVPQFDRWYVWAGTHWQEDETFEIVKLAKRTVLSIYAEASRIEDDEQRKQTAKWAAKSEQRQRVDAMIALLRSEPGISRRPDEIDQHPMLLPCANGTLDLATGDLRPPNPDDLLTKRLPVAYDPAAVCPTWERFLHRIMDGDTDLIAFIQRLIGHALTGDATGKYMVFMYGPKGNNGKSTLVETVMRLLGPYAMKSPTEMVMAKSYRGGIPNDIARLRGVRFTVTNEVDEGMTLSESVVKDLTGYDTLTARFMRAEFFDFTPTHKLWIYGNHKPEIRGTDAAIWDRVKLIPFDVEIPKGERDPDMLTKLIAELPGILAWAVRGNALWQRHGIAAPAAVAEATGKYQNEQDAIGQFIADCCDLEPSAQIGASALYQVYELWSKRLGLHAESGTKFGGDLTRRGFATARSRMGNLRCGLRLNEYGQSLTPTPAVHWSDRD